MLCSEYPAVLIRPLPEMTFQRAFTSSNSYRSSKSQLYRYRSMSRNTPERTKKRLVTDDVAGRMKGKSQGEHFWWGKH